MRAAPTVLLVGVVAVNIPRARASLTLTRSADARALADYTSQIIEAALTRINQEKCFPIVLTDGVTPHLGLYMADVGASWGVGVFNMGVDFQDTNMTQTQLSQVVDQARRLRQVSWCVMVVVVSEDPAFLVTFAEWSLKGRLLVWSTRLLVVTSLPRDELRALLASHWIFSMMSTMAFNFNMFARSPIYDLYAHLPYTPTGSQMVQVASWTPTLGFLHLKSLSLFPDKFQNFHGMRMNATALPFEPYWITSRVDGNVRHSGMDYSQLVYLGQALNFTLHILPSSSWKEVTDQVEARRSFVASIVYVIMSIRLKKWDYTYPFDQDTLGFAMAKPVLKPSWLSFCYPLGNQLWAGIFTSALVFCSTLMMITRSRLWRTKHGRLSSGSVVLEVVGSFLGQGLVQRLSASRSNYILVGSWLIFSVVVSAAYRGSLIASLNLPRLPPRPETAEELIKAVERVTYESYGSYYKQTFLQSSSEILREIGHLLYLEVSTVDGLTDSFVMKQAHCNSRRFLKMIIAQNFSNADGSNSVYIGRDRILPALHAWPVPHDAPYMRIFDKYILALWEAGLYVQWEKETLAEVAQASRVTQRNQLRIQQQDQENDGSDKGGSNGHRVSLAVTHLQGPLSLLLLGLLMAGLAFMLEKVIIPINAS